MLNSDENIPQNVLNCTILRNIFEPLRKAHCSTMQIYTHETYDRRAPLC